MSNASYPYSYSAYGFNIASQIPVTGFQTALFEIADIHIEAGMVPKKLDHVINEGVLYQSNEHEYLMRLDNVAAYYIKDGGKVIVQRLGNVPDAEISAFIVGTSFGALLHQKRMLPLHASSVIFKDKCFVFAGNSGSGKTTLAAALIKAGGLLVADDISVVVFSENKPTISPAFPTLKIWEDSLKHLGFSTAGLERVRGELKKFYLPVNQFRNTSTYIHGIYILNTHNRLNIEPLYGMDKFRALKKHTYLFRGISKTELALNHFQMINKLAAQIPVFSMTRPTGEINTDKLLQVISEIS